MTPEEREKLAIVERNLAILQAGEQARDKQLTRISNALFGKNGESGVVENLKDLKNAIEKITIFKDRSMKILLWVLGLIVAPILGTFGFFALKILAHMDEIMAALDYLEKIAK